MCGHVFLFCFSFAVFSLRDISELQAVTKANPPSLPLHLKYAHTHSHTCTVLTYNTHLPAYTHILQTYCRNMHTVRAVIHIKNRFDCLDWNQ